MQGQENPEAHKAVAPSRDPPANLAFMSHLSMSSLLPLLGCSWTPLLKHQFLGQWSESCPPCILCSSNNWQTFPIIWLLDHWLTQCLKLSHHLQRILFTPQPELVESRWTYRCNHALAMAGLDLPQVENISPHPWVWQGPLPPWMTMPQSPSGFPTHLRARGSPGHLSSSCGISSASSPGRWGCRWLQGLAVDLGLNRGSRPP